MRQNRLPQPLRRAHQAMIAWVVVVAFVTCSDRPRTHEVGDGGPNHADSAPGQFLSDMTIPDGLLPDGSDARTSDAGAPTDAAIELIRNAHYVDCSKNDPQEDGTFEHPWNSIADVNAHAFEAGEDLVFAVNTTCTLPAGKKLKIDWDGSEANRVVIGAYHGKGLFGLDGNARPVFDGASDCLTSETCAEQWSGAINANPPGEAKYAYLTIENLEVRNTHAIGIQVGDYDHVLIQNIKTHNTGAQGVVFARGAHSTICDSETSGHSRRTDRSGASIEVTSVGAWDPSETYDVLVARNRVHSGFSHEGIGVYTAAHDVTIEHNEVYDHGTYHIYKSDAYNVVIRHNLVYRSSGQSGGYAIVLGAECAHSKGHCLRQRGSNQVYGNLIAGDFSIGIRVTNPKKGYPNCPVPCLEKGARIHSNTLVDTDRNFGLSHQAADADNQIYNNLSVSVTEGTNHTNNHSALGFTWSHNFWHGAGEVAGNAAHNARIGDPRLTKTTGWRELEAGNVVGDEFSIKQGSDALGKGMDNSGNNQRITKADFTTDPIGVSSRDDGSKPSIGAWTH